MSGDLSPLFPDVSVAVIAGGAARRMGGVCKGRIEVEGAPIIERILTAARPLSREVFIVANDPLPFASLGLSIIADETPGGHGPLEGIATALAASSAPRVLVLPGDMPFLTTEALARLLRWSPEAEMVIAQSSRGREPLVGVYRKSSLPAARQLLAEGVRRPALLLALVQGVVAPVGLIEDRQLININEPGDLAFPAQ